MKTRNLFLALFLIAVLIFASVVSFGDDKVSLKLNLTKGKTYIINTTTQSVIVQKDDKGKDQKRTQTIGMTLNYLVQDVDASGLATIKLTFTAAKYKMGTSFGVIEYDSQNTKSPPPASALAFSAMIGQSLVIKLQPNGKVQSIDGVDAMINKIVKTINMGNTASMIKQQFGESQLKEMFEGLTAIYPETPIGPGDTWEKKSTVSRGYPLIVDRTYKVADRKDGILTINVTGNASPNSSAPPMDMGIAKLQYTLSGTEQGVIKIKEATGMMASTKTTQNLSGQVESIPSKQGEKSVSAPLTITSTVTSEITEQ